MNFNSMRIYFLSFSILLFFLAVMNTGLSAQDIDDALRYYDQGRLDRVREALDLLEARYFDNPKFLFLKAVFETNGERAFALYQEINETAPDDPIFERVLWRMCQYYYAKGLYKTCSDMLTRFLTTFPDSDNLVSAREMQRRIIGKLGEDSAESVSQPVKPSTVYTIQIAAFGSKAGAQRGLNYYRKLGITQAYMKEHRVGSQLLYKIWVGEFTDKSEARKVAEELLRKYKLSAYTLIEKKP